MLTIESRPLSAVRLSIDFLAPYYKKGDPFESLLARSTYLTKYSRDGETWTDTIRRVVEGNCNMAPGVGLQEAEMLFHLFWTGQSLPAGRGLWTGGIDGIPADSRFNCWGTVLRSIDDWCWTANQLMLGGGVGVSLLEIDKLLVVASTPAKMAIYCGDSHPNVGEVKPEGPLYLNGQTPVFMVPDSREGWVEALRVVLAAAWSGRNQVVDVSEVRARGERLKRFGGVACGPGPLATMLRRVWEIVQGARGRKLTSVECLDITNHIGFCIKSGNIRRSALIILGDPGDQAFRNAKKDTAAVMSHRHTSNNSIAFQTWEDISAFDWKAMVDDLTDRGEPGLINLPLIRETDPGAVAINPCGEVPLHNRESCNLASVYPSKFQRGTDPVTVFRLATRYALRQRLVEMTDPETNAIQRKNMRIGLGLGGICDFDWTVDQLAAWYREVRKEADVYADYLKVSRPLATTTVKPDGTTALLHGNSPGIHAPFAPYYIRRTRIAQNDDLAQAMMEAGVPYEQDQYDSTGQTLVFEFPMQAAHARETVQTQTVRKQFVRQAAVQKHWADNSVSCTISFDKNTEQEELACCLKEFVPSLKSTSCMATAHGYAQPPYEAVTQDEFVERYNRINHQHPLTRNGDVQVESCESGICPVR
jgi:ribonucleoside-triphosphate reductase